MSVTSIFGQSFVRQERTGQIELKAALGNLLDQAQSLADDLDLKLVGVNICQARDRLSESG